MASIQLPSSLAGKRLSVSATTSGDHEDNNNESTADMQHLVEPVEDIDWATLKKSEVHEQLENSQAPVDKGFLRQRLQRENSYHGSDSRRSSTATLSHSRRGSLQQIRRSVVDSATKHLTGASTRKSGLGHARQESKEILLTDLELWTALVSDYTQTAIRLPILTSRKIRAGIPQPLRGLVWQAMSGARDTHLEGLYETLSVESTPFEQVIGRDLARTFPQVEMFKEEGGAGQLDLGKVLRAFSLYDADVGYCQGLGFLVAPLLMNMAHCEAFCVLVRMMEGYGLRSMFTPTLAGLKLRLYQFENLLDTLAPSIGTHLKHLDISPAMYASQWFLSLFAVTCPLDTLHRLYDLMLAEGIPETMMRTAITLLVKNEDLIMSLEMEEVMKLFLSAELWAVYGDETDVLIEDIVSFTSSITADGLIDLETQYREGPPEINLNNKGLQSIATSFLGRINPSRLFSGSFNSPAGKSTPTVMSGVDMSRTSSKISTLSIDATSITSSTTENPEESTNSSFSRSSMISMKKHSESLERQNKQLNEQIEDLIEAMSESHREVVVLKEDRDKTQNCTDELKTMVAELLDVLRGSKSSTAEVLSKVDDPLLVHWMTELSNRLVSDPLSDVAQLSLEKIKFLETQLDDRNHEVGRMRLSLQSLKAALEATQKDKIKVEKALSDMRLRKDKGPETGMRELRLSRPDSTRRGSSQNRADVQVGPPKAFRRASTFNGGSTPATSTPSSPDLSSASVAASPTMTMTAHEEEVDALRLELVQAKAAIAIAQQEAEEAKYALRMSRNAAAATATTTTKTHNKRISISRAETAPAIIEPPTASMKTTLDKEKAAGSSGTAGTWFWRR